MSIAVYGPEVFDVIAFRKAKKTKGLKAKPLSNIINDDSVLAKFLIDTLEGKEPIEKSQLLCIGVGNDAWPQTAKNLLKKYNIVDITGDGWLVCEPKPENSVEFIEVPETWGSAYLQGLWGEEISGVKNLQAFKPRDMIARQPDNHSDMWVVRRKIWDNSYSEI